MDAKLFITRKYSFLIVFFMMLSFIGKAQNPGDVVQNYGQGMSSGIEGFNSEVLSIKLQPDGKIIVGGHFTAYRGTTENKIIRLNPDGTKDGTFNTGIGFSGDVSSIALQPDGKIIIGGYFSAYNGTSANRIIRLNPDGTKDTSFNTGTGFSADVYAIALQPDGKIIVAGGFSMYNGITAHHIVRLNPDGTKDTSFNAGNLFSNLIVYAAALQSDGKIIIGGSLFTVSGASNIWISRLNTDGTQDMSFNAETDVNYGIFAISLQPDGKIIVGGRFTQYDGTVEKSIIRLNTNGTKDVSFNAGAGFNDAVNSIVVQPDGKIILGGRFTSFNDVLQKSLVRLNTNGSKDTSFNIGSGFGQGNYPTAISGVSLQPDGKIVVVGWFTTYNDLPANRIIRLNMDGTRDTSFEASGLNNSISSVSPQPDGKIIVGGSFTAYKGTTENHILRLNPDASKDSSFNTGTGFDASVYTTTIQNDGKIIVGGYFTAYKGLTENKIARLNADGTNDTSFNTGTGFNNSVKTAVVQPDGKILIGGSFTSYNGSTQNNIIRLNPNGTKDTSFSIGSGFNSPVESIVLQPDGKIIVAGGFTTYNGTTANRILRLNPNGTKDASFDIGPGFDNSVFTIAIGPDGKIIVGGEFITYKGIIARSLIRLNLDGSKDTSFDIGTGFNYNVYTVALQSNGKIIIGGNFTTFNGTAQNGIVRLNPNGTKDSTFAIGSGFNEYVGSIAVHADGKITAGGGFTSYNISNSSAYLITLHGDATLSNEDFEARPSISLWPNPVQSILHINDLDGSVELLKIYNLQGKLIYESDGAVSSIDVSSFASGLYIAQIKTESNTFTKKFIKQ